MAISSLRNSNDIRQEVTTLEILGNWEQFECNIFSLLQLSNPALFLLQMYSLSSRSAGSSAKVFLVNGIPG